MNLVKVNPTPAIGLVCILCHSQRMSNQTQFWADTEGQAFKDYYCEKCAPRKEQE